MSEPLKFPAPVIGGKARIAPVVWPLLGDCDSYIEPFCFSAAVLLNRPADHFRPGGYKVETINDANHFVPNFWRAVRAEPEKVAEYCDWPVTEICLHSRHWWLVKSPEAEEFRRRMKADPDYYDAKVAGWWTWGACCWIGGAWCVDNYVDTQGGCHWNADGQGNGVNRGPKRKRPLLGNGHGTSVGSGVNAGSQQIPELDHTRGVRVHPASLTEGRPQLTDAFDIGRGVNQGGGLKQQVPNIGTIRTSGHGVLGNGTEGTCDARRAWLVDWMRRLSDRIRLVRVCYGHWNRICDSDSTMTRLGTVGAFLDPPYAHNLDRLHAWVRHLRDGGPEPGNATGKANRDANLYVNDKHQDVDRLVAEVQAWCLKWGQDRQVRIVLCGYDGEHNALEAHGWKVIQWESAGGYSNQRRGKKGKGDNAVRERLWVSPFALEPANARGLFDEVET